MKDIIQYTLGSCKKCMKCLRACPTEAISISHGKVEIKTAQCILCDACINSCSHRGLQAKGATLDSLNEFDYKVILLPTAILSDSSKLQELETLISAIKKIGFDEVVDISDVTGGIYQFAQKYVNESGMRYAISSTCPAINRLIEVKYPMLMSAILPFEYPVEVAAKLVRKRLAKKYKNVGIYSLCECVAKLSLAKHPYGNMESNIDYAITIAELFPLINKLKDESREEYHFCKEGIHAIVHDFYDAGLEKKDVLAVDGLDKVQQVLELAEFENLKSIRLLSLYACPNGCIGGRFLWGNPYVGRVFIERFLPLADKPIAELTFDDIFKLPESIHYQQVNMKEQVHHFLAVNEKLEQLPGFDCGACGFASCRAMAHEIVAGHATLNDCKIIGKSEVK